MIDTTTAARPRTPRLRPAWVILAAIAVAVVVLVGVAVASSHRGSTGGGALRGVHLTAHVVSASDAQSEVDALAGRGRLSVLLVDGGSRQQAVVGRLTFDRSADDGGQYGLFVIDNDSHRVAPVAWGVGPAGSDVGQGWDGRFGALARSHSWLAPLTAVKAEDGGYTDPGTAVVLPAGTSGPVTFAAYLPLDAVPISSPARQLTIALAYLDRDGHPGWVQRLSL